MSKVVAGMTISLDGFVNDSAGRTSALYRDLPEWRTGERGLASIAATGAVLMGRRTFEMASDPDWYVGNYEYQVPLVVVTGRPPRRIPKETCELTFNFVSDGVRSAVTQAKAAAGERDVTVVGGPTLIQALLRQGLVDEIEVDVVPVILGGGQRLFEGLHEHDINLERTHVCSMLPGRTSLRFAVKAAA